MTRDPVAWFLIEPGWKVVARDGTELGKVHEVIGDGGADIFNGIAVSTGLVRPSRYVPAERVGAIYEGRIELALDAAQFRGLDEHEAPPPSEHIRADTTDITTDDR